MLMAIIYVYRKPRFPAATARLNNGVTLRFDGHLAGLKKHLQWPAMT